NNVVAHIHDLHGLARGVGELLADHGVFVAEFPYLVDLLDQVEYDTIYHEHLSYFTVAAAVDLFRRFDLALFDVQRVSVHGGSIRIFVGRGRETTGRVTELLSVERERGLGTAAPFAEFAERVRWQHDALIDLTGRLRSQGKRLDAYGAAAQGNA